VTTQPAIHAYNVLYSLLKSKTSQRGTSFNLYTFNDGSAVVKINATQGTATVSVSAIVTPIYDETDTHILRYRVSSDDETVYVPNLQGAGAQIMKLVRDARRFITRLV